MNLCADVANLAATFWGFGADSSVICNFMLSDLFHLRLCVVMKEMKLKFVTS